MLDFTWAEQEPKTNYFGTKVISFCFTLEGTDGVSKIRNTFCHILGDNEESSTDYWTEDKINELAEEKRVQLSIDDALEESFEKYKY